MTTSQDPRPRARLCDTAEVPDGPEPFSPGEIIGGRYLLRDKIGEGGMGFVFRATDERLGRTVAVKVLRQVVVTDDARKAFLYEARLMARMRHANVVPIYDVGTTGGVPFIVMHHQPGQALDRWVDAKGGPPVAFDTAAELLAQACAGVAAIHAAGVIHHDIKPGNMLVSPAGAVAIADLGLAKKWDDASTTASYAGTPGYIAPEVIAGVRVDVSLSDRVDVYALGATAYWLLTGRLHVAGKDRETIIRAQLETRPVRPSVLQDGLPLGTDALLVAAVDPDPAKRPDLPQFVDNLLALRTEGHTRSATGSPPYVLVIDDDRDQLVLLEAIAREAIGTGDVVCCSDPVQGLAMALRRRPSLIITDLRMPDIDGAELTARIRSRPDFADVPILVLTAFGGASEWEQLRRLGATTLMLKPIHEDVLYDTIRRLHGLAAPRRGQATA